MKADDILKEVLNDPSLISALKISEDEIQMASMDIHSNDASIEIIKSVIRGGYNGTSAQMIFNEIKRIKGV